MTALTLDIVFVGILIFASIYDIEHYVLPDEAGLALAGLGMISAFVTDTLQPLDAVVGAALGGSILFATRLIFSLLRHEEGLGLGDVKWFAAGGLWIGWSGIGPALMIATVAGLVAYGLRAIRTRRFDRTTLLPFGPFLSFGIASVHLMLRWS